MKQIALILLMVCTSIVAFSETVKDSTQQVLIYDDMSNVTIYQDSAITQLMIRKCKGILTEVHQTQGYRLQIYASNAQQQAKSEAYALKENIEKSIDLPIYLLVEPPFWKVRIGNFANRENANAYKETFLKHFPELQGSTYVVPDQIEYIL